MEGVRWLDATLFWDCRTGWHTPKCKKQRGGTDADAQEAGRAEYWKSKREGRDGCAWARAEALVRAARDSKLRCLCVSGCQWPVGDGVASHAQNAQQFLCPHQISEGRLAKMEKEFSCPSIRIAP